MWRTGASQLLSLRKLGRQFSTFTDIPIIDIASLVTEGSSPAQQKAVGKQLHNACVAVGFFYVTGHGVPTSESDGIREKARAWFGRPEEDKAAIALSPKTHYRGYQRLGANVTRYDGQFQRDWHEAIDLYREAAPDDSASQSPVHGRNPWPTDTPFAAALQSYARRMDDLGAAIMRGIALGLDLDKMYFEEQYRGAPYWVMRVIHYPPLPEPSLTDGSESSAAARALAGEEVSRAEQLSCGEHTDYGMLTIVNQDAHVAALQVKNAEGAWITAAPVPGAFVCNVGDMLKVWTNGLYEPTLHRVLNPDPSRSRVSIPYFHEPGFDTVVRPIAGMPRVGGGAALQETHYGRHLESKVLSNFEL